MKVALALFLAFSLGLYPVHGYAQEEEEEDDGNDSYEQSTEDSSDETTQESTNQPSRNTTDPSVEVMEGIFGGHDEGTEREGEHTDRERALAMGVSGLTLALVIVTIVAIASSGTRVESPPAPAEEVTPNERRAAAWLAENDEQLRVDLARGSGPTIQDLAAVFALRPERRPAFGLALRTRRGDLLATLESGADEKKNPEHVRAFLREVGRVLQEDETLRADWENWRLTYGVARPL